MPAFPRSHKTHARFLRSDETLANFVLSISAARSVPQMVVAAERRWREDMSWELQEFKLEEASGPVQVFNFEAALAGAPREVSVRGDGIYMTRTRQLRLNRETELSTLVGELVQDEAPRFTTKAERAAREQEVTLLVSGLRDALLTRIGAQPQVRPVQAPGLRNGGAPQPMLGNIAYYFDWQLPL
jgi:hypothetical protein